MGQLLCCAGEKESDAFFDAVREGNLTHVKNAVAERPDLLNNTTYWRALTALHIAASSGHLEVLGALLEQGAQVDAFDRYGKTPLMHACKRKKWTCAERLLDHGANVRVSGSSHRKTCLHYAAKGGNAACVQRILEVAASDPGVSSWGLSRFVNAQDRNGITALYLASLACNLTIVHILLSSGALVSVRTVGPGGGRSPLHAAARGGSVECVSELLAWGADRRQRDNQGNTPYGIANEHHNFACATVLNPSVAEPVLWPSPLKFMNKLEPEARTLLEAAMNEANSRRLQQQEHEGTEEFSQDLSCSFKDDLCSICFERLCTIQMEECGHRMCAACTLSILCLSIKPEPRQSSSSLRAPACPFCRRDISHLIPAPVQKLSPRLKKSRRIKPSSSGRIVDLDNFSNMEQL